MDLPYRSYALISRQQLARNYGAIRAAAGPGVEVAGVVKANAYGHGALEVSRVLLAEGARWLAVASVEEGVELRRAGVTSPRILVMGGALPYEGAALIEHDLTPAVHTLEQVRELDGLAAAAGRELRYHLKIDSGMGRLGTRATVAEIAAAVATARHAVLEGLMTHYASAGDFESTQSAGQLAYYQAIVTGLRERGVAPEVLHTSASSAIAYGDPGGWHTLVRAGLSLYGYVSPPTGNAPASRLDVAPVLTWKAKLVAVKDLPAGALVGYGATFRAPAPMRIGIVGVGYADGVFRCLSRRGSVIAGGRLTPILGTVSMDVITIDLSHAPELATGDEVTLIGSEGECRLDAERVAAIAGTISYEILCGIGERVRRVYI